MGRPGPLLLRAALDLGVPLDRTVLAMAYGDELTNMLEPLGLAARHHRPRRERHPPYTLRFMA